MRKLIFLILVTLFAGYAGWAERRPVGHYLSDLRSQVVLNVGQPSDRGNLLGIQPELFNADYQSEERLRLKLHAYLAKARDEGLLSARTVVVFPQHIGTWLFAVGEKPEVYDAQSLDSALRWMALSNPLKLARGWLGAKGEDRMTDALLRMKSVDMAHDYQTLFGSLAHEFGVTIVAGSIVLPSPRVVDGVLRPGNGRLSEVSVVFGADGQPLGQPQRKLFPVEAEQRYLRGGDTDDLHIVDTPVGRLAVLISADSWHPEAYAALGAGKAALIAVPAFAPGNQQWQNAWHAPIAPEDSDSAASATNGQNTWQQQALPGQLPGSGAQAGIAVFLRGHLWNLGSSGPGVVVDQHGHTQANDGAGARLLNLWL
ncbi:MAG: hypothetical protein GAK45_01587 [Pseudomonas citronellolis]|nr:MAG: hypothetical protein GAK45_01587 [Pseudomonas citronellolis]